MPERGRRLDGSVSRATLCVPLLVAAACWQRQPEPDPLAALPTPSADGRQGQLNFTGYADPQLDMLLERAARELDPAQRYGLLQLAMQRALGAHALVPLAVPARFVALRPGLSCETGAQALPALDAVRRE